jgi:DNA-directed RNA polymerase specialized sigma24 family protein
MAECHKCEHGADVADGKYRRIPFDETPCAACVLSESPGSVIEFDPERDAGELSDGLQASEEMIPVDVLRCFVVSLLELRPELRDVVCWRFSGLMYKEIAEIQGVTTAAVEARHRRAMKIWPELEKMFVEKVVKHRRRLEKKRGKG